MRDFIRAVLTHSKGLGAEPVNLLTRILGALRDFPSSQSSPCSMFRGDTSTLPKESHQKHAFLSRQNCLNTHFQSIGICEYCLDISSKQCDQNCSRNKFTGKNRLNVQEKIEKSAKTLIFFEISWQKSWPRNCRKFEQIGSKSIILHFYKISFYEGKLPRKWVFNVFL